MSMTATESTTTTTTTPDAALISTLEAQVLQLADHDAWLDAQIRDLECALSNDTAESTEEEKDLPAGEAKFSLEKRIDILKQDLATAATVETVRDRVILSAHSVPVVLRGIFRANQDEEAKIMSDAIDKRDAAVEEYLSIHKDLQTARQDLVKAQGTVIDLQDENRRLAQALARETAAIKEGATSQEAVSNRRMAQRIEEELKTITIKYNVVSNVLQGLLLESGVDWSNDPHYLDVMLKLGPASD
ncbi:hypothetical protein KI688_001912 [Linnemannia hyalina]|uniref:Centromere protein H C-terminal domain-containing protein n=1 Tax=Linnemannia hyalina TaxID=64524 RepID=A0A9P7XSY3_9FUNG|nr:hypothetical protein KI688_001912 [Linnemannia hyalina]